MASWISVHKYCATVVSMHDAKRSWYTGLSEDIKICGGGGTYHCYQVKTHICPQQIRKYIVDTSLLFKYWAAIPQFLGMMTALTDTYFLELPHSLNVVGIIVPPGWDRVNVTPLLPWFLRPCTSTWHTFLTVQKLHNLKIQLFLLSPSRIDNI